MTPDTIDERLPFQLGHLQSCNTLWLTLTNLCNIHCKYCFNYVSRCHEHMPVSLTLAIISAHLSVYESGDNKPFCLNYFGGEPTLNQDSLVQAIDFINANDVNCDQLLMTNGVFNAKLLDRLLGKNVDFQISFDGEQNNLRFNKNLTREVSEQTVNSIKRLVEAGELVTIRSTIHHDNVSNMSDMVHFCDLQRVPRLKIAPICDFGDAKTYGIKQPSLNEFVDNFYETCELGRQYGVEIERTGLRNLTTMSQRKMAIPFVWLPDGYVAMTITYATSKAPGAEKIIIGKLNEEDGQIELDHPQIDQMKTNFLLNREKYCSECPIKNSCCGNLQFTPFATDTFVPSRDRYFCDLGIKMAAKFPDN